MNKKEMIKELNKILERHNFYYEDSELEEYCNANYPIELTGKAYGDSSERYIEEVFDSKELRTLKSIASKLNIKLPNVIWYD